MPHNSGRTENARRSLRLPGYDYAQAGAYFVTVCTRNRECLFGTVVNGEMRLNAVGEIVHSVWSALPTRFAMVNLDVFVLMPNHIHGIINLVPPNRKEGVGAGLALPTQGAASSAPTLGDVLRAFKSIAAIRTNRMLGRSGQPLWQRNYYERVVRNEKELQQLRQYITENPLKWELDKENPEVWV